MMRASMRGLLPRLFWLLPVLTACASAGNSVANFSHYDTVKPDFVQMRREGIVGVIHEATYPLGVTDAYYGTRQKEAGAAGLLWGAYHFADATDPVRQADRFLNVVESRWKAAKPSGDSPGVLLVLDFEKNGHYPGGTMRVDQAVKFVERVRQRTGKYPGVYSGEYRIRDVINGPGTSAAAKNALTKCWLWVANYHYEPKVTTPWRHWNLWQYTGDGICDLPRSSHPIKLANFRNAERNIFRGSAREVRSFWETHGWNPGK
jgi:lysozyme